MSYATKEQLESLAEYMASQIRVPTIGIGGGYAPIGAIQFFDATVAPQDWLACDGTVYNIADYPQLADWYEAQHGSKNFYGGNGTTTFGVPDLQGEFLRGTGTNSHTNQGNGANVGVHQNGTEVPNITYYSATATNSNIAIRMGKNGSVLPNNMDKKLGSSSGQAFVGTNQSNTVSNCYSYTSRPTNTSFLICVKAVVAGDVYSTEERVVGTWIDGKPVYQKTIRIQCPTVSTDGIGTERRIDVSNLHIAYVQIISGALDDGSPINNAWGLANGQQTTVKYYFRVGLNIAENIAYIQTNRGILSNAYGYITLQYTKTTD